MIRAEWERIRQEWRQNRRLRLGVLVVVTVLGIHAVLALADRQEAMAEQFRRDAELFARLESASREQAWPKRAAAAEAAVANLRKTIPGARTEGVAQAELQAWLSRQAEAAALQTPVVRVESTVEVPGHTELWQVLARLEATTTDFNMHPFMRVLSEGLPWVQVERVEVVQSQPTRVSVIVRAYYRKTGAASGASPDAIGSPAKAAASSGAGGSASAAALGTAGSVREARS